LLFLANEDPKKDINLYVSSPGGSVTAGLGIIDTMNFIPCDVGTYIIGQAASMGSLIACSGAKGKRCTLPNSKNLMHQPLLGGVMEGQATDLQIEAEEMLRLRDVLYKIYADASLRTVEQVESDCERNCWLDAKGMKEFGLVDRIIDRLSPENA
jgi:ATP-dependent Clp protease protease subunit